MTPVVLGRSAAVPKDLVGYDVDDVEFAHDDAQNLAGGYGEAAVWSDAVADEQTTRWCKLELEVVSPLTLDGSERVKATVSVTFVSEAL